MTGHCPSAARAPPLGGPRPSLQPCRWHILQYTPAALASSSHPDALCDLVLRRERAARAPASEGWCFTALAVSRWELVAYGELSLSLDGYMWVLTLLPLLASCVLLSLLLVRLAHTTTPPHTSRHPSPPARLPVN